ncbi:histidine phosphatase superfamily [Delphinella strobiligena]|nr:histidine phosphatase superfamily [Delphinella strobiligena]
MPDSRLIITAVPGYFQQSEQDTDASVYDYAKNNFGLIDRSYDSDRTFDPERKKTQWQRFANHVEQLRKNSNVDYRVLYLGRHGQGYHNVAESYYGTAEWDRYWSKLEGGIIDNEKVSWADAHLTDRGIQDALEVNAFWKQASSISKIPAPQKYYTSPLHRCCATANLSFSDLELPETQPFIPEIRELLRETNGEHTCDRRSTASYIHSEFPSYTFEPSFSETDDLWKPDERETDAAQTVRLHRALEEIFAIDQSSFLSITSHSGSIAALLRAVGHRTFALPTGGVMPLFVKVERK